MRNGARAGSRVRAGDSGTASMAVRRRTAASLGPTPRVTQPTPSVGSVDASAGLDSPAVPPLSMPHVDGVEHRDVLVRGQRLHVAFAGPEDGPVVLLQHGFPQHWYEWRHHVGALAGAGARVVMPDFRGFGWSEHPVDEDFRKETLTDDLIALIGELDVEHVRYAGHDWGCWAGYLLCLRRPDLVERAVLMSTRDPWPPPEPSVAALKQVAGLWYQVVLAAPGPTVAKLGFIRQMFLMGSANPWPPEVLEAYLAPLRQPAQRRAAKLLYRQMLLYEMPALARGGYRDQRLTVPTRYLIGEHDPFNAPEVLTNPLQYADDWQGEVVPGAGHFLVEEAVEPVAERLRWLVS
jgi:pimeloyl-ACP methyl ester carboxylesterase